jgi:hypothetical protein
MISPVEKSEECDHKNNLSLHPNMLDSTIITKYTRSKASSQYV